MRENYVNYFNTFKSMQCKLSRTHTIRCFTNSTKLRHAYFEKNIQ